MGTIRFFINIEFGPLVGSVVPKIEKLQINITLDDKICNTPNKIYILYAGRDYGMKCIIKLIWSEEEKFWYSESMDERFGLTLESGSLDVLIERVKMAVPEMFELIGYTGVINLSFEIERTDVLGLVAS